MMNRPHMSKKDYLASSGWKRHPEGGWLKPGGDWPDPLTEDEAYKIQKAMELEKKNRHEVKHAGRTS